MKAEGCLWMPFPRRAVKKRLVALVLSFPAVALLVVFFFSSVGRDSPLLRVSSISAVRFWEPPRPARNYTIHIWKHGERMKRRFLRSYGQVSKDHFRYCTVRNCALTTRDSEYPQADAVMFHLHQTKSPLELPELHPLNQMWIFFTDESPYHTFYASRKYTLSDYDGLFNWSMTYRRDSDIPVPYGRTVRLPDDEILASEQLPDFAKLKNRSVAILGSNCGGTNHRWEYVHELQRHIPVDIYGHCGKLKCPGHFNRDCPLINKYKFYLAFENSNCKEYITEKLWWNAYEKEALPIVMGAPKRDYETLCPPNSFIHVDDYDSPEKLARYIEYLDRNDSAYNSYFQWKAEYKVLNEHGYFGSPSLHLCRICEKLNSENSPKTYSKLETFWDQKRDCQSASWVPS